MIEDAAHREHRPIKRIINDALRKALAPPHEEREPYVLVPHVGGRLRPGIDPAAMNKLVDELEDEALVAQWDRDL